MMTKRLLSIILALAMIFGSIAVMASCDGREKETESSTQSTETESTTNSEGTQTEAKTDTETETKTPSETESDRSTESETNKETGSTTEIGSSSETQSESGSQNESESGSESGSENNSENTSENGSEDDSESDTDTEPETVPDDAIYENGDEIKDAGTQWDDDVFALTENNIDESKATVITAAELLVLLQNKDALTDKDVYRVTDPLVLSSGTKYYGNLASVIAEGGIVIDGVSDVVVKELIIKGDIKVTNSKNITFFQIDVKGGDVAISIDENSSNVALKNCKAYASSVAIDSKSEKLSIYRNYLCAKKGLVSTGDDLAIQDSKIVSVDLGISSSGAYCTVKNNLIEVASAGIGVDLTSGSYNGLVALNVVKDAQISIKVTEGYNCVVLLNSAIRIVGEKTTNIYVVENKLGGAIELIGNEYVLCDGNTFIKDGKAHPVVNNSNTNFNGDNLHDVDARAEFGAKEELLPHTNKDLFVGMERQGKVRDVSLTKTYTFTNYMRTMGRKNSVVIVPPGVYTVSTHLQLDVTHKNTTFYAYGVYEEKDDLFQLLNINGTQNVTVKGLTLGYQFQSSGQVYVLEKLADQKLRVVTNAGYINDFGKSNTEIFNSGMCDMFFEDSLSPWQSSVSYSFVEKCDDGTMILQYKGKAKEFASIGIGDVMACRLAGDNSQSIYLAGQNVKLKDCVLYGYAAALAIVSGGRGTTNVSLERLHNTVHSSPLISEETYNWYKGLEETYGADLEIYIDELGRHRGGLPRVGSVDATHISGAQVGTSATSCLFESMCDDGSNQRGGSSRLAGFHDNLDGTTTLYYKGTLSQTYYGINIGKDLSSATPTNTSAPKAGDRIFVYASNGHVVFDGTVLSDSVEMGVLPQCTVDHGETEHSHCALHMIHYDVNRDCICDDESCKTTLHFDIGTAANTQRDGKCDTCGIKVYTDFNSNDGFDGSGNGKCDVTGTAIVDENGDGFDDVDGTPIITDMVVNDKYNEGNSTLTYQALYTKTTGAKAIITYNTIIKSVTVKTEDVNFEAFEGYDMTDNDYFMDQKILFDNLTLNSAGFVFDNTVVQYTRSRGILVKTVDATIKNCTFRDHGMTSVLLSVETTWGESTVPQNITVEGCLFDNTGCLWGLETNMTQCPIAIQGLGNLSGNVEVSEDTLPCRDIRIIGNKFINTNNNYCISMSAAQGITIKNNVFTARPDDTEKKYGRAIYIDGCANIDISGNTYSEIVKGDVTKAIIGYNYIGLKGADVVDADGNRLLPEQKGPKP